MMVYRDDREARKLIRAMLECIPRFFLQPSLLRDIWQYLDFVPALIVSIDGAEFAADSVSVEQLHRTPAIFSVTVAAQHLPQIRGQCELRVSSSAGCYGGTGIVDQLRHEITSGSFSSQLRWLGSWEKLSVGRYHCYGCNTEFADVNPLPGAVNQDVSCPSCHHPHDTCWIADA